MRQHLDIPLTLILTATLSVVMLWLGRPAAMPDGSDKVVHLIAFAALAFPVQNWPSDWCPSSSELAFGGVIELIQPSFNRSADINDWIADVFGVARCCSRLIYRRYGLMSSFWEFRFSSCLNAPGPIAFLRCARASEVIAIRNNDLHFTSDGADGNDEKQNRPIWERQARIRLLAEH